MPRTRSGNQGRVLPNREEILEALRMCAFSDGRQLSMQQFSRRSGISITQIYKHFDSWLDAREEAGLPRRAGGKKHYTDDELLAEYHRVTVELHRFPSVNEFNQLSAFNYCSIYDRFGPVPAVRRRYRKWLSQKKREAGAAERERPRNPTRDADDAETLKNAVTWLQREWFDLRVGFELLSSHFKDNDRSPLDLDVLVVLEHDWFACPVTVLEFRNVKPEVDVVGLRRLGPRTRPAG